MLEGSRCQEIRVTALAVSRSGVSLRPQLEVRDEEVALVLALQTSLDERFSQFENHQIGRAAESLPADALVNFDRGLQVF